MTILNILAAAIIAAEISTRATRFACHQLRRHRRVKRLSDPAYKAAYWTDIQRQIAGVGGDDAGSAAMPDKEKAPCATIDQNIAQRA